VSWLPDGSTGEEGRLLNGEEVENMSGREVAVLLVVLLLAAGTILGRSGGCFAIGRLRPGDSGGGAEGRFSDRRGDCGIRIIVSRALASSGQIDCGSEDTSIECCD
jgi:hypothetical protein